MIAGTGLSVSSGTVSVSYGTSSTSACVGNDARLARAWVNFDGNAASNLTGTYSRSGTTVTCTATAHGLLAGTTVYLDFTSGTATDGLFTVATVADANTFTVTHGTSGTTSGNVTLTRQSVRGSYNVSSVGDNGTGDYTVNFTTALASASYAAICSAGDIAWGNRTPVSTLTASSVRVFVISGSANAFADSNQVFVAVFG